jgi:hypothetical protein
MLAFLSVKTHPKKKAIPNPTRASKDSQGKGVLSVEALRQRLEWVRGRKYKTTFNAFGSALNEKKVPPRKVIGNNTKLLKVAISS